MLIFAMNKDGSNRRQVATSTGMSWSMYHIKELEAVGQIVEAYRGYDDTKLTVLMYRTGGK